jgi:hypothetical protein
MGLYMSRMILEKNIKATIKATNIKEGIEFNIKFT